MEYSNFKQIFLPNGMSIKLMINDEVRFKHPSGACSPIGTVLAFVGEDSVKVSFTWPNGQLDTDIINVSKISANYGNPKLK